MGALATLLATNSPAAASNLVRQTTGISVSIPNPKDPVEKELKQLMEQDDDAHAEVDEWIRDNEKFAAKGAGVEPGQLRQRILDRLDRVRKDYDDFLQRHPNHARARVAYASFLDSFKGEEAAEEQLEKALALETNNPAIYNNLANIYGHHGPVKKAFEYYAKAIELNPLESIYYHNFGTTVFLFRNDAREFYGISEQEVFSKALALYSNAMRMDPQDFPLASDVAQTYYGIQPLRADDALRSWTNALNLAHDEIEREGVYVHIARIHTLAGRFNEARAILNTVTNEMYATLKKRVSRNIDLRESTPGGTNLPPATAEEKDY
jgi:tetratricopeptide (TPR) repeat protein